MSPVVFIWCAALVVVLALRGVVGQWLHARASGWARLSRRYPAGGARGARRFDRAVIRVQAHWYHLTPTVEVGGAGIRVAMRPVYRPFHPPVFIPWDDIAADPLGDDGTLQLQAGESGRLTLTGRAARAASALVARRARGAGQRSA